jgi:hypothetical protein
MYDVTFKHYLTAIKTRKLNLRICLCFVFVLFHRLSQVIVTKEPDIHFLDDETVEGVTLVRDFEQVRQMQVLLGNYVGARVFEHTFFPALWAIPLAMENIHQLESKPHFMTPKPTGPRFLCYIDSSGQTY